MENKKQENQAKMMALSEDELEDVVGGIKVESQYCDICKTSFGYSAYKTHMKEVHGQ